ncbi:MAG TPA: Rpn family recombination-promoting nuclease/putative transposase [Kofleriaceae bacterium]|jgi:hypothetical protein|nr:Rpn family recombination-promoting nuclease/putative transposase [Kofleriaceae bacterium]
MSSIPYDALFEAVSGDPDHVPGALRAALPAALGAAIDWRTLTRCPGSFVEPALAGRRTDLLFSVTWCTGGEALLYLLFDRQRSPDTLMAYQLLRYMVRIWKRWAAEHGARPVLPCILPLVRHPGERPPPLSFDVLLDLPDATRAAADPDLVRFAYLVDELSELPDRQLRERAMAALAKLVASCFKHAQTYPDLVELLAGWVDGLGEVVTVLTQVEP